MLLLFHWRKELVCWQSARELKWTICCADLFLIWSKISDISGLHLSARLSVLESWDWQKDKLVLWLESVESAQKRENHGVETIRAYELCMCASPCVRQTSERPSMCPSVRQSVRPSERPPTRPSVCMSVGRIIEHLYTTRRCICFIVNISRISRISMNSKIPLKLILNLCQIRWLGLPTLSLK